MSWLVLRQWGFVDFDGTLADVYGGLLARYFVLGSHIPSFAALDLNANVYLILMIHIYFIAALLSRRRISLHDSRARNH